MMDYFEAVAVKKKEKVCGCDRYDPFVNREKNEIELNDSANLYLTRYGINLTLVELAEDKIRAAVKKHFDIEFGEMCASDYGVMLNDAKSETVDLEDGDCINVYISANKKEVDGDIKLSEYLYINYDICWNGVTYRPIYKVLKNLGFLFYFKRYNALSLTTTHVPIRYVG